MIYRFDDFILEFSKSDPIPELTWNKQGKTAIFLLGAPGTGKSTFANKFILPKLRDYKIFDPDEIRRKLRKFGKEVYVKQGEEFDKKMVDIKSALKTLIDKYKIAIDLSDEEISNIINQGIYVPGGSKLIEKQFIKFLENNNRSDVIYDSTGHDVTKIDHFVKVAKENNYNILFVKIKSSFEVAVRSNLDRIRKVEPDYQLDVIEKARKSEKEFLGLEPNAFYVYVRDTGVLYKYNEDDRLVKYKKLTKK